MLTPHDVALMKSSFARIEPLGSNATVAFYDRLFDEAPDVRKLFGVTIDVQAEKLWDALKFVLDSIDNFDACESALLALGARHAKFDLNADHYALVARILIDVVQENSNGHWTKGHSLAWKKTLDHISEIMLNGSKNAATAVA